MKRIEGPKSEIDSPHLNTSKWVQHESGLFEYNQLKFTRTETEVSRREVEEDGKQVQMDATYYNRTDNATYMRARILLGREIVLLALLEITESRNDYHICPGTKSVNVKFTYSEPFPGQSTRDKAQKLADHIRDTVTEARSLKAFAVDKDDVVIEERRKSERNKKKAKIT